MPEVPNPPAPPKKKKISQTGHAMNVDNFEKLVAYVKGYGTEYNPAKKTLQPASLDAVLSNANSAVNAVFAAIPAWKNAINDREAAFENLPKLATRIINAVEASDVSKNFADDVRALVRKIQGKRAVAKLPATDAEIAAAPTKNISAAQTGFESRITEFQQIVDLLASQSGYAPNENDLKVATLTADLQKMQSTNTNAINALVPLSNQRIARDTTLYLEPNNLVDTASDVKKYIKSVFGADSPQYKQVQGLSFKKITS